jgi:hypothetical protein
VIVTVAEPRVARADAVKVRVEVQVGEHDVGTKPADTPTGRPEADNVTGWDTPLVRVNVTVVVDVPPRATNPELGETPTVKVIGGITVNVAGAESPVLPVTVITYGPAAVPGATVNEPVTTPAAMLQVEGGVDDMIPLGLAPRGKHEPVSPEAKPPPEIVTGVPSGPEVGIRVIVAGSTVNVALAVSPVLPLTVTKNG